MTQAVYARHRGVSRAAVGRAVRERRIPVDADGRIDPLAADAAWDQNTSPRARGPAGPAAPTALELPVDLTEARTAHEWAKAQLAELELKVRSGELVPVSEVRDAAFKASRASRDLVESIPDRIADDLASVADASEIRRILRVEIARALDELASLELPAEPEAAAGGSA
jgi:phage terminase Nu1 subunit (DNA packaging protein)